MEYSIVLTYFEQRLILSTFCSNLSTVPDPKPLPASVFPPSPSKFSPFSSTCSERSRSKFETNLVVWSDQAADFLDLAKFTPDHDSQSPGPNWKWLDQYPCWTVLCMRRGILAWTACTSMIRVSPLCFIIMHVTPFSARSRSSTGTHSMTPYCRQRYLSRGIAPNADLHHRCWLST